MKNYELRMTNYRLTIAKLFCVVCALGSLIISARAQSINQNSPTPIVTSEISGRIPARDLGDARLTNFFYTFDGTQGDVFINVVTTNFNGDIDVFTADNLRPLAKITVYADASNNETGRVIYLRQPLKLILRVEGRTPNDDAATFRIKFAGSFAPSTAIAETVAAPEIKSNNQTDVRVNSVGTITEIIPKPTPTPKAAVAKIEKPIKEKKPKVAAEKVEENQSGETQTKAEKNAAPENTTKKTIAETAPEKVEKSAAADSPTVVVTEETAKKSGETAEKIEAPINKETEIKPEAKKPEIKETGTAKPTKEKKKSNAVKPVPPSELTNISLIILFKDGTKIERPMSEILKFSVDKGVLTVISKDGIIGRYSILNVEKMTIQ